MAQQSRVRGIEGLERALLALPEKARVAAVRSSLKKGGRPIMQEAKRRVPVLSGELKRSIAMVQKRGRTRRFTNVERDVLTGIPIGISRVTRRGKAAPGVVQIGFRRPHSARAHLTEFGTRHSRAQPFMGPALEARGGEAIRIIARDLWAAIAREAEKLRKKGLLP